MLIAERESNQLANPVMWPEGPPDIYEGREQKDFLRRLGIAEAIKGEMRRKYAHATRARVAPDFENAKRRMEDFWSGYEEVNLLWVPEDPVYSKVTTGLTTTTTNDILELGAASAGQLRILESFAGGENVASTVARLQFHRVTTQGTGTAPTVYTPEKFNTRSPAASATVYGALSVQVVWATAQAVLAANPLFVHGFNSFGGSDRWVAQPGEEVYAVNAEFMSLRSFGTTPIVSCYVVFEEL